MSKYFSISCIDYRYDILISDYLKYVYSNDNFYMTVTAGSALSLGYEDYCKKKNNCHCHCTCTTGDPYNSDMYLLKNGIKKNLEIALSLATIDTVYLMNHQDCGAFKAYLSFSNYPVNLGDNNEKEIKINTDMLMYAKKYIQKKFPHITTVKLGLIDINGSVGELNLCTRNWKIVYIGTGTDTKGLWWGQSVGN